MKNNYKILYNVCIPHIRYLFYYRSALSTEKHEAYPSFIIYLIFTLIKEIDTAYFLPDRFVYAFNS